MALVRRRTNKPCFRGPLDRSRAIIDTTIIPIIDLTTLSFDWPLFELQDDVED